MKLNKTFGLFENFLNKNFFIDSRDVREDSVFICIKGLNDDGHKYIKPVLNNYKKTIIICEKKSKYSYLYKKNQRVLICQSTKYFMKDLALIKRYLLNENFFIGITGSSGKTTLKEMLYKVLSKFDSSYRSQKSFNNDIGLPISLINQKEKSKYNVYELGMNKLGEIDYLSKILKPNLGIITNIGDAHLGKLGSIANIAKAKSEIIKNITKNGTIILNRECKFFNKFENLARKKKLKILTFGSDKKSTISYKIINFNKIKIQIRNKKFNFKLQNNNINNINNLLVCFLVLDFLNLKIHSAKKILEKIKNVNGRGNIIKFKNKVEVIDDSYNSNPSSLKGSISDFYNTRSKKKKILVIGDMLELGRYSKKEHIGIGKYLLKYNFFRVYLIGKQSKNIFERINTTFWCKYYSNIDKFSKDFDDVLLENCMIMFKASNGTGLNKLLSKKLY
jgi:UDP-N-acetylmuramoyl-tripeptide--D-alanyl-D-alanine ligase